MPINSTQFTVSRNGGTVAVDLKNVALIYNGTTFVANLTITNPLNGETINIPKEFLDSEVQAAATALGINLVTWINQGIAIAQKATQTKYEN